MRSLALGAVVLAACGSVAGNTPDAKPADSGGSSDTNNTQPDAPPAPRCNPTAGFQTPIPLTALNSSANDMGVTLSADELTIYFCSNRSGGPGNGDIWYATRASTADNWGTPQVLPGVNTSTYEECNPSLTADGKTLYLQSRGSDQVVNINLVVAERASTSVDFDMYTTPGTPLNAMGTTGFWVDADPYISPDGNTLYFVSTRDDSSYTTTHEDLYFAKRVNGTWQTPQRIPGIPTANYEGSPVFTADELTIYFSSYDATNGQEIMMMTRASTGVPFSGLQPQNVLNTPNGLEAPQYITADGCELYFSRAATGNSDWDLFVAKRGM